MKILSFDIESCNGNPREASLCSFGYCISDENFNIIEQRDILVNPVPKRFTLGNKWGKGIKLAYPESEFRRSPLFCEVYEQINRLFKECDLVVGFSIINDLNYLNCACCHYGLDNFKFKYIDVQEIYSIMHKGENKALDKIMKEYNVDFVVHQSDEDARATLILLKELCKEKSMLVTELLDYYGIVYGENGQCGYKPTYSLAQMTEKHGLKRTVKLSKYLFLKHLSLMKKGSGKLKGKKFYFSKKIILEDLDKARNFLSAIYSNGGVYSLCMEDCNLFVKTVNQELENGELTFSQKNSAKFIDITELKNMLGDFPTKEYDDTNLIKKYYNKKTRLLN